MLCLRNLVYILHLDYISVWTSRINTVISSINTVIILMLYEMVPWNFMVFQLYYKNTQVQILISTPKT